MAKLTVRVYKNQLVLVTSDEIGNSKVLAVTAELVEFRCMWYGGGHKRFMAFATNLFMSVEQLVEVLVSVGANHGLEVEVIEHG